MWVGFLSEEVGVPSPKFQVQEVGLLVETSVKLITPVHKLVRSAVKFATGGEVTGVQVQFAAKPARVPVKSEVKCKVKAELVDVIVPPFGKVVPE